MNSISELNQFIDWIPINHNKYFSTYNKINCFFVENRVDKKSGAIKKILRLLIKIPVKILIQIRLLQLK